MKRLLFTIMVTGIMTTGNADKAPQLGKSPIEEVISAMTLEEKAHFVVGTGMKDSDGTSAVVGSTDELVPGAAGTTYAIPRLGIPSVVLADGPAGLRIDPIRQGDSNTYYCTHFPIGTMLACTWDTTLVSNVGRAIGNEVLEYGADVLLAPALNIHRNPLCGRNFEYYSEDPVVTGNIAAAYVNGIQSNGVGTSVKHFAVNNQETNRMGNDAQVSQRALREIYLKGFEIAIKESAPWTVMSSYNRINGTYASENHELLETLLRDEWGYKGMVMTDWFGGSDGALQEYAGNDLLMPGEDKQYEAIVEAVKSGKLDEKDLDRNVRRILELILQTPRFKGYVATNHPDLASHAEMTRRSATDGMVLLKNCDETLPLGNEIKSVALYGCSSYDWIPGGTGSGNVNRAYTVSLLDGLRNAGYTLADNTLEDRYNKYIAMENERNKPTGEYAQYLPTPRPEELTFSADEINRHATDADVAIITIGRNSGEFLDRTTDDFELSAANKKLLEDVSQAFHAKGKKVVVILNIGGVIETKSWQDYADAVLCAWQGGQEGGNSVVDVLNGRAYPSGKLTMTFPIALTDVASTANFPLNMNDEELMKVDDGSNVNNPVRNYNYTRYNEDIYVGYRYFDSFDKPVSYPFGYGQGYTTFEYTNPKLSVADGRITVTVDVVNTGKHAGKEIVQLYAAAPDSKISNKPAKELKAFSKSDELQPGETATVSMTFPIDDLAYFDEGKSSWVVAPGKYELLIGASSRDIRHKLEADVQGSAKKVNDIFKPQVDLDTLKRTK